MAEPQNNRSYKISDVSSNDPAQPVRVIKTRSDTGKLTTKVDSRFFDGVFVKITHPLAQLIILNVNDTGFDKVDTQENVRCH